PPNGVGGRAPPGPRGRPPRSAAYRTSLKSPASCRGYSGAAMRCKARLRVGHARKASVAGSRSHRALQHEVASVERVDHEAELDSEVRQGISGYIGIEDRHRGIISVFDEIRDDEKFARLGHAIAVVEEECLIAANGLIGVDGGQIDDVIPQAAVIKACDGIGHEGAKWIGRAVGGRKIEIGVASLFAAEVVAASSADEGVVSNAADQTVVAGKSVDDVVAGRARQRVAAQIANYQIGTLGAIHMLDRDIGVPFGLAAASDTSEQIHGHTDETA